MEQAAAIPELEKTHFGYKNVIMGWIWCILGFWMGMVIGWWSFDHTELFAQGSNLLDKAFGPVLHPEHKNMAGLAVQPAMFSFGLLKMSGEWFNYDLTFYDSTARRLIRLSHVCFLMIPMWNILFGKDIDNTFLTPFWKNFASWCMVQTILFLPPALVVAALIPVLKYVMIAPATFACVGLTVMAFGKFRLYQYHKSSGLLDSDPLNIKP